MNNLQKISIINIEGISLDDVLSHCDNKNWTDGEVAKSRYSSDTGSGTNKAIRDVDVSEIDAEIHVVLNNLIQPHVDKYAKDNNIKVYANTFYTIAKYSKGQFFTEHTDSTLEFPRAISAILYLNDDYEGGTLTFGKIGKTFKPKANTLFIFPSSDEFSHSADPVVDGIKYVIVGFWS